MESKKDKKSSRPLPLRRESRFFANRAADGSGLKKFAALQVVRGRLISRTLFAERFSQRLLCSLKLEYFASGCWRNRWSE
ncbi:MAG TPA: hypothetical protein VEC36_05935 [Patescibacteria group bacterium]|nr:hypothetical protein [Patescibacteria group bacterium]